MDRVALIHARLSAAFSPASLEIDDDSWRHAGHAGARQGGHFAVRIVADAFAGKSPLQRHRLVYAALGELMQTEIHALQIDARPPAKTEPS